MYDQKPRWWPEAIPFAKPGVVPPTFKEQFGAEASLEWHKCLKQIIYLMHCESGQDYKTNVSEEGWKSFLQKYEHT